MLNPLNFISKFIKSSNQKELDRIAKIVEKVNSFEGKLKEIPDEDFPKKTSEFKKKLKICIVLFFCIFKIPSVVKPALCPRDIKVNIHREMSLPAL